MSNMDAWQKLYDERKGSNMQAWQKLYDMRTANKQLKMDTFESDIQAFDKEVNSIYGEWNDPQRMQQYSSQIADLVERAKGIQSYFTTYGKDIGKNEQEISSIIDTLQNTIDDLDRLSEDFVERNNLYEQFKSKDEYEKAQRNGGYYKEYENSSYEEIQNSLSELKKQKGFYTVKGYDKEAQDIGEKIQWLENFYNYGYDKAPIEWRKERYRKNQEEIEKLAAEIEALGGAVETSSPLPAPSRSEIPNQQAFGNYIEQENAKTAKIKELTAWRNALIAENNRYDRGQGEIDKIYDEIKAIKESDDYTELSQAEESKIKGIFGDNTYDYINDIDGYRGKYSAQKMASGGGGGLLGIYRFMTNDEIGVYNYYYAKEGKDSAETFLEKLQGVLEQRQRASSQEAIEGAISKGGLEGVAASTVLNIASIPVKIIGGPLAFLDNSIRQISGQEINPDSSWQNLRNFANDVRGITTEQIEQNTDWEFLGQNVMAQVYNALMSTADSVVGGLTMGPLYTIAMGSGAAADKSAELYEKGASNSQIFWGGLSAGIAETVFEKIPLENLIKPKNPDSVFKVVWEILKQAGIEGFEEIGTEIANTITDSIIMGSQSDLSLAVKAYQEDGLSYEEAYKKALLDKAVDISWAGIAGFMSGSMSSSAVTGYEGVKNIKAGHSIQKSGNSNALIDFAMQNYGKDTEAYKMAERLSKNPKNSALALGSLYMVMEQQNQTDFAKASDVSAKEIQPMLEKSGMEAPQASAMAKSIAKSVKGVKLSAKEAQALTTSKEGQAVYQSVLADVQNTKAKIQAKEKKLASFLQKPNNGTSQNLDNPAQAGYTNNRGDTGNEREIAAGGDAKIAGQTAAGNHSGLAQTVPGMVRQEKDRGNGSAVSVNRGEGYAGTAEFRELQEASRGMSFDEQQRYLRKGADEAVRGRISSVFKRQLDAWRSSRSADYGILNLEAKGNRFTLYENVDGAIFHDVFEIVKRYLENGELVDLHDIQTTEDGIGYDDCDNYLSDDGLSGFSVTPDGDLISVFNASGKSGFLRAISDIVKEKAKTLDCYASSKQNLMGMYSRTFGFKAASVMDYNMEYDHDNIAANHDNPQVAFMVNTEQEVETKHFGKDQYEEAKAYRNRYVGQAAEETFFMPGGPVISGSDRTQNLDNLAQAGYTNNRSDTGNEREIVAGGNAKIAGQTAAGNLSGLAQTVPGMVRQENDRGNGRAVSVNRGEGYAGTAEFRELQEASRGMSDEISALYHSGERTPDEGLRGDIARVFQTQINAVGNGTGNGDGILTLTAKGNTFYLHQQVNGALFHDIFEIAKGYLKNGELVDLHETQTTEDGIGYEDCDNYLSDDGLSGFSITPDGDLISVFNASGKSGFLNAIAPLVKERAKTLDCYNSSVQPLMGIYSKVLGFKAASVMDYNMEYDHDNIAANHDNPQVAFMVNTEQEVETKHFDKDQYEEAKAYRDRYVGQAAREAVSFVPGELVITERSAQNPEPDMIADTVYNMHGQKRLTDDQSVIRRIGKRLGWTVEFGDVRTANGAYADGKIDKANKVITISTENTRPIEFIFKHEMAHRGEGTKAYTELVKTITQTKQYENWLREKTGKRAAVDKMEAALQEEIRQQYEAAGESLTESEARAELMADFMGDMLFADESGMKRLLQELEPQKRRSLLQWIKDALHYIRSKIGNADSRLNAELELLESKYTRMLSVNDVLNTSEMGRSAKNGDNAYSIDSPSTVLRGKYDYSKSFAEQIEDYKNGKIPKRDTLIVGKTPEIFQRIGLNKLPMTINQTHVDYAINGTKDYDHFLGEEGLKQLPEALKHPVAVISSKTKNGTSLVAILDIRQNGKQIVVPVVIDGFGTQNGIRIDGNALTSVYGKDFSISKVLYNALNDEANGKAFSVYYVDTNKAAALFRGARVLMPKVPSTNANGFIHNITEQDSPVKPKFSNQTETQQFKRWFGNSKVVNEDGTPKIVYHGSNKLFTIFSRGNKTSQAPKGVHFFTDNEDVAYSYTAYKNKVNLDISSYTVTYPVDRNIVEQRITRGVIYPVYLSMKNPYVVDFQGRHWGSKVKGMDINEISIYAKENGYDGIIAKNIIDQGDIGNVNYEIGNTLKPSTDYIVFNPAQIKSATDNIGTFDGENSDIRYSVPEEEATEEGDLDNRVWPGYNKKDRGNGSAVSVNRGEGYAGTAEFRELQETSRGMSGEISALYHSGERTLDEGLRGRISSVFKRQLDVSGSSVGNGDGILTLTAKGNTFHLHQQVNGALFHDVFEIAKGYLKNGELVDLHDTQTTEDGIGYEDCDNYLSDDGLSGFSITPDGDLISVFNASGKRGFLNAIAPLVKERAKTLDCYNSPAQPLLEIYEKTFGFKAASVMDYNMEYDHDNIAANHNNPQVAFMVNTEQEVETKHFDKDQYEEAKAYRDRYVGQAAREAVSFVPGELVITERSAQNPEPDMIADTVYNMHGQKRLTDDQSVIRRIGKRLGWTVEFGDVRTANGAYADGKIDKANKVITISTENTRPIEFIFKHELTHFLEINPVKYKTFANTVIESIVFGNWMHFKGYESIMEYNTAIAEEYIRAGEEPFGEYEANLEIVADFVGENLFGNNQQVLEKLLSVMEPKQRRTFAGWIKDLFKRLKNAFSRYGDRTIRSEIEKLEELFMETYRAVDAKYNTEENKRRQELLQDNIKFSLMNDRPFSENVNEVLNMSDAEAKHNAEQGNFIRVMKDTPEIILKNVEDAKNIEVIISFYSLYLAGRKDGILEGHYHNLGNEILYQIPEYIANPDALVRMKNGRLNLLTQVKTPKGNNGIISIELNTVKDINNRYKNYNLVVSIFSAKDSYVENNMRKNGVKVEYTREDLPQVNSQLYKWLAIINEKSSNDNIAQDAPSVNSHFMQNSKKDTEEIQYSIGYTTENKPVVVVEENILEGVPKKEWVKTVKETIANKFSKGIPVSGRLIKVNAKTRGEYTNSAYSKYLKSTEGIAYVDKLKAANNLDEIVLASTNYINEDLKHERKDSFKEFARGDILLRIGNHDYSAKVIVGFTEANQMVLYDIIDFTPIKLDIKNEDKSIGYAKNAGSLRNDLSSDNTIPQKGTDVNTIIFQNRKSDTENLQSSIPERDYGEQNADNGTVITERSAQNPESDIAADSEYQMYGQKQLTEDQRIIKRIGNRLGWTVEFGDVRTATGAQADGKIDKANKVITISTENTRPIEFIFKHEMAHRGEGTKAYTELVKTITQTKQYENWLREKTGIRAAVDKMEAALQEEIRQRYEAAGESLTESEARAELMADFMGDMLFADESGMKRLLQELEPQKRRSLLQWIKDALHYIRSKIGNADSRLNAELELLESKYVQMLRNSEALKIADQMQYSLVGKREDGVEIYETSESVKSLPYKERKRMLLDTIKSEYKGRVAKFYKNGKVYYAILNENTARKGVYGDKKSDKTGYRAKINIGADGNYFELVENSKYINSAAEQGKKTNTDIHDSVERWDYYQKTVQADGKLFDVLINVADKGENQYVYDVTLQEQKNNGFPSSSKTTLSQGNTVINSINQDELSVNSIIFQNGKKDTQETQYYQTKDTNTIQTNDGVKYSIAKSYKRQVDDVLNNNYDKNNHVYMGNTPLRLVQVLGLSDLPMLVTNNHIYSMSVSEEQAKKEGRYKKGTHYHDLGAIVKELPNLLNEPVLIIKSNTKTDDVTVVAVTSAVDKNGFPVMAAIKPNGKGNYCNVELDANIMLSGYGRNNVQNYVQTASKEDRILYAHKKSNQQHNPEGVQFPNNIMSADYSNSLARYRQSVNSIIFQNAENDAKKTQYSIAESDRREIKDVIDKLNQSDTIDIEEINESNAIKNSLEEMGTIPETYKINTPERESQRAEIVKNLMALGSYTGVDNHGKDIYNGSVNQGYRIDLVVGLPAAGKSSVLVNPLSKQNHARVIDSDMAKEMIPEFNNGIGASAVHEESKDIVNHVIAQAVGNGDNIVYPIVGGGNCSKLEEKIKRFKRNGYTVYIHLNELPLHKAMGRMLNRYLETGRFIPPEIVYEYQNTPIENFETIIKTEGLVNGYSHYSNDVARGEAPILKKQKNIQLLPGRGQRQRGGLGKDSQGIEGEERNQEADLNKSAFSISGEPVITERSAQNPESDIAADSEYQMYGQKQLTEDQSVIRRIGNRLGWTVEFGEMQTANGAQADGKIDKANKVITISTENTRPIEFILKHELAHRGEGTKAYTELVKTITQTKQYENWLREKTGKRAAVDKMEAALQEEIRQRYEAAGENLTESEARAELMADFMGDMLFADENGMQRLLDELEPKERRSFLQWIKDALNYIRSKLGNADSRLKAELELLESKYAQMLKAVELQQRESREQYSFGGIYAKNADRLKLDTAKQMEESEATPEEIRRETGWYRGYDGLWRFEIDDSKMKIKETNIAGGDIKLGDVLEHPDLFAAYPQLKDVTVTAHSSSLINNVDGWYSEEAKEIVLNSKYLENAAVKEEIEAIKRTAEYQQYQENLKKAAKKKDSKRVNLLLKFAQLQNTPEYQDYVKRRTEAKNANKAELFDQIEFEWQMSERGREYQKLKTRFYELSNDTTIQEITVEFYTTAVGIRYLQQLKNIEDADIMNNEETRKALMHEIQHAVQYIEGFANGSSPEFWKSYKNKMTETEKRLHQETELEVKQLYAKLQEQFGREAVDATGEIIMLETRLRTENLTEKELSGLTKRMEEIRGRAEQEGYGKLQRETEKATEKLKAVEESIEARKKRKSGELYLSTAGEIEARDAVRRLELSAMERKQLRPDIDRTDVVFADEGLENKGMKTEEQGNLDTEEAEGYNEDTEEKDRHGERKEHLSPSQLSETFYKELEQALNGESGENDSWNKGVKDRYKTVDDLINGLRETTNGKGVARNFESFGGYRQTLLDFDALNLTNVKNIQTKYGFGKVGILSDGTKVVARQGSTTGGATLEIKVSNSKVYKIRY